MNNVDVIVYDVKSCWTRGLSEIIDYRNASSHADTYQNCHRTAESSDDINAKILEHIHIT